MSMVHLKFTDVDPVPLFISFVTFSSSSRSSPVLAIGMNPPQAPQQTHQQRGFNLGGYVVMKSYLVIEIKKKKEKEEM